MTPVCAVLVPVKPPAVGKTRLGDLPADLRERLAAAFALDTVTACRDALSTAGVVAITDDAEFAQLLVEAGCVAIPDGVAGDLNATLEQAAAEARRRWPDARPVAVCADLPALRPEELDAALDRTVEGAAVFVADAEGVGTTLYSAPYDEFSPRFGPGSRRAHLEAGAVEIDGTLAGLRRDVDQVADLQAARDLGLGPHTLAVLG